MNTKPEKKIDILNRGDFIQRAVDIVKLISSHKGNMTFAIDGAWGCGKTFVLEEIEGRLSNDPSKNYLVIPYNCWQYDYYDEPLVALVAALNDFADSTKVIPEDAKTEIKHIFGKVGLKLFSQIVKSKIGVDAEELISTAKDAYNDACDAVEKQHEFDSFYGFKQVLETLHEDLKKLTEKYTLALAVDELDRCLPEYAIKVLERLHHVTDELPNTVTIISIDKKRLVHTINSIFGEGSADDYLKKYIRFTIDLNTGTQNGQRFLEKHANYYQKFTIGEHGELNRTEDFLEELFQGVDVRSQERTVEKASIIHDMLFEDIQLDYSCMYTELFIATLYYHYHATSIFNKRKKVVDNGRVFDFYPDIPERFKQKASGFNFSNMPTAEMKGGKCILSDMHDVYMMVFNYWYYSMSNISWISSKEIEIEAGDYYPMYLAADSFEKSIIFLRTFIERMKTIG